jgi:hypothetical protein
MPVIHQRAGHVGVCGRLIERRGPFRRTVEASAVVGMGQSQRCCEAAGVAPLRAVFKDPADAFEQPAG